MGKVQRTVLNDNHFLGISYSYFLFCSLTFFSFKPFSSNASPINRIVQISGNSMPRGSGSGFKPFKGGPPRRFWKLLAAMVSR